MSFFKKIFGSDKDKLGIEPVIYKVTEESQKIYDKGAGLYYGGNFEEAFEHFSEAFNKGHDGAAQHLGEMYRLGQYVTEDMTRALEYYKVGAEREVKESQFNLGYSYYTGDVHAKDPEKMVYWYTRSAKNDFYIAQFQLAICYITGLGAEQNIKTAKMWLRTAMENGHPKAAEVLADL